MKTLIGVFSCSLLLAALTGSMMAGTRTPVLHGRLVNQQQRINQGIRSGSLTRGEARYLDAREAGIRQDLRLAKSDGNVSPSERHFINQELNQQSRSIYREKHDAEHR